MAPPIQPPSFKLASEYEIMLQYVQRIFALISGRSTVKYTYISR